MTDREAYIEVFAAATEGFAANPKSIDFKLDSHLVPFQIWADFIATFAVEHMPPSDADQLIPSVISVTPVEPDAPRVSGVFQSIPVEPYIHTFQNDWAEWWAISANGSLDEFTEEPYVYRTYWAEESGYRYKHVQFVDLAGRDWTTMKGRRGR